MTDMIATLVCQEGATRDAYLIFHVYSLGCAGDSFGPDRISSGEPCIDS